MTTAVGVCLVGAGGRMGLEITRAAAEDGRVRIAAAVEHPDSPALGRDIGTLAGLLPINVVVEHDLENAVKRGDVIVDLSLASATARVIEAAVQAGKPLLCGTTGVDERTPALFEQASRAIAVLHASNLSQGIALMASLVEQATRTLGKEYDVEIIEMHHRNKVDAPSGTALTLAEAAAKGRGLHSKDSLILGRAGHTGVRPEDEIGIHAVRGGSVFGDHTVVLAGPSERIEITHRAASRDLLAAGAVKAALFLAGKPAGSYTMKEVFGI